MAKAVPSPSGNQRITLLLSVALILVTAWLYWPVRQHEFIALDDPDYLLTNPQVKAGITTQSLHWAFTQYYSGNWHPLTWISHMLDCEWFGLDAGRHHLMNVAFHAVNAVLLFLFLQQTTRARWPSAFVAALFAFHPLHVESVAWAAERKDMLSTFFFLLTLMAYSRYATLKNSVSKPRIPPSAWYIVALVLFGLGLMSKSMLVTLPFVLLLVDLWPLGRLAGSASTVRWSEVSKLLLEKAPFFALSVIFCVVTLRAQSAGQALGSVEGFPVLDRILNSLTAYLGYIGKMFWPAGLSVFYPFPAERHTGGALIALLILVAVTVFAVAKAKARPYLCVGWLWYLGTLVPVIGLIQVGGQAMADRYTYLPLIGLFIVIAWGAAELSMRQQALKPVIAGAAVLALGACGFLTTRQVPYWRNNETLFGHAAKVDDQNYMAWSVLGDLLRRQGKPEQAAEYLNRAVQLRPNSEIPWHGLALSMMALNKPQEAESAFQNALRLNPQNAYVLTEYAELLVTLRRLDEAMAQLEKARQTNPNLIEPRLKMVMIFQLQGRLNDAANECVQILKLDPGNQPVRALLGSFYSALNKPDEAIACYREVIRNNPDHQKARIGLGFALVETHDLAGAESEFSTVLQTDPKNARALDGLGVTIAQAGQVDRAKAFFFQSLQIDPNNPDTHLHLAMSLSTQDQAVEAIREYRKVLELDPTRVIALNNLAWVLASHSSGSVRDGKAAVDLAERACRLTENRQPFYLGTLAAAYAEAGRFEEAVATAEKAQALARETGLKGVAERNEQLLQLYRDRKPFHESPDNTGK